MLDRSFWPIRKIKGAGPDVFLTFDDGPDPLFTPSILNTLDEAGAKATFFLLGLRARKEPQLVRQIVDAGHAIGLHGVDHTSLWFKPRRKIRELLLENLVAIRAAVPQLPVWLFRPPYGRFSLSTLRVARSLGLRTVLWSLNSRDYETESPDDIFTRVLSAVQAGDIVLLHDGPAAGSTTSAALPKLLSALRANGFAFPTLTDALNGPDSVPTRNR